MSSFDFSSTIEGKLYTGRYSVVRENITVSCEFGEKTIQLGSTYSKTMARTVLGEIVRGELRRRGSSLGRPLTKEALSPDLQP